MKLRILAVGRLKPGYLRDGAADFQTRLKRLVRLELVEVAGAPDPAHPSSAAIARLREEEGRALLSRLQADDYIVAMDSAGQVLTSDELAEFLRPHEERGGRVSFLIGGSWGLSPTLVQRARTVLSLSPMTFTHGLARLILLEQLYRAVKILRGETYHK